MTYNFVKVSGYKYVITDSKGNISGAGFSKSSLDKNLKEGTTVRTIKQYEKEWRTNL